MYVPPRAKTDSQEPEQLLLTEANLPAKRKDGPGFVVQKPLSHRRDDEITLYFKIKWADSENLT